MKRIPAIFPIFFIMSCSVKENREMCPGVLSLVFPGACPQKVIQVSLKGENFATHAAVSPLRDTSVFRWSVPRGRLMMTACCGIRNCRSDWSGVSIPLGEQMDEIYSFSRDLEIDSESGVCDTVLLEKQYALMKLVLENVPGGIAEFEAGVEGTVCGVSFCGNVPVKGPFSAEMTRLDGTFDYSVRLPRQDDGSLRLVLRGKDSEGEYVGNSLVIPVGDDILAGGYDWKSPRLDDILVCMDYGTVSVSVRVRDWTENSGQVCI